MISDHYPHSPGFKSQATSAEAADASKPFAGYLRERALECLRREPLTADEVAAELGASSVSRGGRMSVTTHTLTESAIAEVTRDAERRIHLDARKHSLEACAVWILQWETECGIGGTDAQFYLHRALASAKQAQEHWNAANGVKMQ